MDAEKIAQKARRSIGMFCIEECRSYCCRKGYLVVDDSQLRLLTKYKKDYTPSIKPLADGKYSFFLGATDMPCPRLKPDFKCSAHRNKNRPSACKEFPLFIKGKEIILSHRCLAVRQGLLFPYVKQLEALGYKVRHNESDYMESVSGIDLC
ncbi:TPA: YkgJ family cysteine cluster protein [Candidatus Woesearchaeota archaeon]|nr:YkgJ family cysteine cluster protein [Candidatus Woesearchaeota archaeon]